MGRVSRVTDTIVRRMIIPGTHSGQPRHGNDALHSAGGGLREEGEYPGVVRKSLYTRATMHPLLTGAAAVGAGLLVAALWRGNGEQMHSRSAWDD